MHIRHELELAASRKRYGVSLTTVGQSATVEHAAGARLYGIHLPFVVIAGVLFGSAGTLYDGRAWVMLAVFFGCAGAITVWLWFRDRALLERRVKAAYLAANSPATATYRGRVRYRLAPLLW